MRYFTIQDIKDMLGQRCRIVEIHQEYSWIAITVDNGYNGFTIKIKDY